MRPSFVGSLERKANIMMLNTVQVANIFYDFVCHMLYATHLSSGILKNEIRHLFLYKHTSWLKIPKIQSGF